MTNNPSPQPALLSNIGITRADPIAEAARKILAFHYARMVHHEPGTRLGENIEALHDMRVATRRMRSAFEVLGFAFKPKFIKPYLKGLRRTGKALGRVRDLDVFIQKTGRFLKNYPGETSPDLTFLMNSWQTQRKSARTGLLSYLDDEKYQAFKRDFNIFLSTPGSGTKNHDEKQPGRVGELVPVLIYSNLAAVRALQPTNGQDSLNQYHRLRIEFKKFRYTLEFFQEVLGGNAREVIRVVKSLQDHLGSLNDTHMIELSIRGLISLQPLDFGAEPLQIYLKSVLERQNQLLDTFPGAWEKFNSLDFRKNLALAVAEL